MMPHLNSAIFLIVSLFAGPLSAQNEKARSFYQQGILNNQKGLLIEASVQFTNAIAESPKYAQAYYQRGLSFNAMGEKTQAIKDFKQSVDHKIVILKPYLTLINHYKSQSQFLAALIITDQLIANIPDQAVGAYYDKGQIFELMNKPKLAIKAYELTLQNLDEDMASFEKQLLSKISELTIKLNNK